MQIDIQIYIHTHAITGHKHIHTHTQAYIYTNIHFKRTHIAFYHFFFVSVNQVIGSHQNSHVSLFTLHGSLSIGSQRKQHRGDLQPGISEPLPEKCEVFLDHRESWVRPPGPEFHSYRLGEQLPWQSDCKRRAIHMEYQTGRVLSGHKENPICGYSHWKIRKSGVHVRLSGYWKRIPDVL